MNDEVVKALATIPEEMESYAQIRRLVEEVTSHLTNCDRIKI